MFNNCQNKKWNTKKCKLLLNITALIVGSIIAYYLGFVASTIFFSVLTLIAIKLKE